MTRDEIIKLAREAGMLLDSEPWDGDKTLVVGDTERLERFAALVAERERAECAKVCDQLIGGDHYNMFGKDLAEQCATAIRERNKP